MVSNGRMSDRVPCVDPAARPSIRPPLECTPARLHARTPAAHPSSGPLAAGLTDVTSSWPTSGHRPTADQMIYTPSTAGHSLLAAAGPPRRNPLVGAVFVDVFPTMATVDGVVRRRVGVFAVGASTNLSAVVSTN